MEHNPIPHLVVVARKHLLSEGFKLDGSDPAVDIFDAVHDWVLSDLTGYDRWEVDNAYDIYGGYEYLAEAITERLL